MNVMIPVRPDGSVEPRFGKAPMVAVAQVDNDGHVTDWHTFKVCLLYTSDAADGAI